MTYRLLKVIHLIGLALFLGSIFGHVVSSVLGGPAGGSDAFLTARVHIWLATKALTLPGLALSVLAGIGMAIAGKLSPLRERWLAVHALLAIAIVVLSWLVVVPAVIGTLAAAEAAAHGTLGADAVAAAKRPEDVFGGLNVLLALAAIALGVFKPKLGSGG